MTNRMTFRADQCFRQMPELSHFSAFNGYDSYRFTLNSSPICGGGDHA